MLKSISKLRNKRKKKNKEPSDKNDNKGQNKRGEIEAINLLGPPPLPPLNSDGNELRRNGSENSIPAMGDCSSISEYEEVEDTSSPEDIKAEQLFETYNKNHADEDRLFLAEFQLLQRLVAKQNPQCEHAKLSVNSHKNRYKNIIACDNHRVKLSLINGDENSDYINASYIDGYSVPNKFIASQGPKESTLNDFWRMIWEQKCFVIVMITELRELGRSRKVQIIPSPIRFQGQQKCEQYWPSKDEGNLQFGDISVEFLHTVDYGSFIKRELKLQKAEETRSISQFQYRAWPDHGVPRTTTALFRFRETTLNAQPLGGGPVLVHCSAGVGRTGTYIALDVLLDQLNDTGKINVFELILEFRMRRAEMVQSLDQYSFIHKLVYEYYVLGDTDVKMEDFAELYQTLSSDEGSGFDSSFKLLETSKMATSRFGSGALERNKDKNRNEAIIPYEHSQVFIRMKPHEQLPLYINASSIQSYDTNTNVILAQAPMQSTIEDFWRMIVDNNVVCIAMLCQPDSSGTGDCAEYWPTVENSTLDLGEIIVRNERVEEMNGLVKTTLTVEYSDREKISRTVAHLRHQTWVEENVLPPEGGSTVLEMLKLVAEQVDCESGAMKPRVLVHCSDGVGRSGVFCTVANAVKRLENEGRVDVLRTVKDLRDSRPCVVKTKEQYKICFDIIREYLRLRESKSNEIVSQVQVDNSVEIPIIEQGELIEQSTEDQSENVQILNPEKENVEILNLKQENVEILNLKQENVEIVNPEKENVEILDSEVCESEINDFKDNPVILDDQNPELLSSTNDEIDNNESEFGIPTENSTEIFITINKNDIADEQCTDVNNITETTNEVTETVDISSGNELKNVDSDSDIEINKQEIPNNDSYNLTAEKTDDQNLFSNDNTATQEILV